MGASLPPGERARLERQRRVGRILAPLWVPLLTAVMRFGLRWRIEGVDVARREFARLRASGGPLLVCANHLTMLDSFVVAHALGSAGFYVRDYGALPWNTPASENFASAWWKRVLVYLMKCVPVTRGGDRREVGRVLGRITWLVSRGEVALVFPEGGRSRSGRVDPEVATYGVGRIVKALSECRVLCVYLRGDHQAGLSERPRTGERFRVRVDCIEPKTDHRGMRGSRDVTRQVLSRLAALEESHLEERLEAVGDGR